MPLFLYLSCDSIIRIKVIISPAGGHAQNSLPDKPDLTVDSGTRGSVKPWFLIEMGEVYIQVHSRREGSAEWCRDLRTERGREKTK